ncbi:hypothetical protein dqs_0068 [Azoarcus olearius]|uniref:hypothetical protein n=1 Tax=Azoarcus sp. (strain BH72) TaxID=418699 RepID=UPI0008063703|nr:hypothetical protein [Azoarcus olearius]ANQ83151.1 hypothetical protein dqs_0068 [Azoarcus olearius]
MSAAARPARMLRVLGAALPLLLGAAGAPAAAAFDPLALQPETPADDTATAPPPWHGSGPGLRLELAREQQDRAGGGSQGYSSVVLDFRGEWRTGAGLRLALSDRYERRIGGDAARNRNALREAYASLAAAPGWYVDFGRINWRNGVGSGYNPTDYLKRGADIEQGSLDPRAQRENRLGTVMLRQQWVGAAGSAQLALIPALADGPESSLTAPGWSRTNRERAALLKLAPTVDERTSLDLLAYTRAGDAPQVGANLTRLLGDAWVLHAEFSRGRRAAAPGAPLRQADDSAIGLAWTTPPGAVLTLEHQHDGGARQRALFARLAWDDAFGLAGVDVSAFVRRTLDSRARRWQIELGWAAGDRDDLRLRWAGSDGTTDPATPTPRHSLNLAWLHAF